MIYVRCVAVGAAGSHSYLSNICPGAKRRRIAPSTRPHYIQGEYRWSLEGGRKHVPVLRTIFILLQIRIVVRLTCDICDIETVALVPALGFMLHELR